MAVTSPRYRVLNFRLSSDEYESIYVSCVNEGYRTVSQFARCAVLDHVQAHSSGAPKVEEQLALLASTVQQAVEAIGELKEESQKLAARIEAQPKRDENL